LSEGLLAPSHRSRAWPVTKRAKRDGRSVTDVLALFVDDAPFENDLGLAASELTQ
jgi:hypothetical protein